jgi:hypothetical protein
VCTLHSIHIAAATTATLLTAVVILTSAHAQNSGKVSNSACSILYEIKNEDTQN